MIEVTTLINNKTSSYMCIHGCYQNHAENIIKLVLRPKMNFCSPVVDADILGLKNQTINIHNNDSLDRMQELFHECLFISKLHRLQI